MNLAQFYYDKSILYTEERRKGTLPLFSKSSKHYFSFQIGTLLCYTAMDYKEELCKCRLGLCFLF